MKNRAISLALASLLFTAMLASCGEDTVAMDTTSADSISSDSETVETVDPRLLVDDELGDYDFGGVDFRIATSNGNTSHYYLEESTGDIVDDAIYARNRAVEDRFNFSVKVINDTGHRETGIITSSISAGDDAIDLICWHPILLGSLVTNDYFLNWYDIPNVNFDKPWWSDSNRDWLTYGDFCPMAIGDFLLSAISGTYSVYYNKRIGSNYDIPDLYETVDNGAWTYDYMVTLSKDIYEDLNGNNELDNDDLYGYTSDCKSNLCTYMWAFDAPIFVKNQNALAFALDLDKTANIVDKLCNTFNVYQGMRIDKKYVSPSGTAEFNYGIDMFALGQSLFANGCLDHALSKLRDMEDDYAILPYPKWDENQEKYYTMVDGSHQIMAVPITAAETERIGTIIEALCAESYKSVIPVYYDTALKLKGTRDEKSIEMLDSILASRVFDFGYIYDAWSGAAFIMQDVFARKDPNFSSFWASKEKAIMSHYNKIIEYFENFNNYLLYLEKSMCSIKDYGAVADGVTINTQAIQAAIDACAALGGGRVTIPAGIYKTGTIWLKSHVELHLEMGATLLASDNTDDYNDLDAFEQNYREVKSEGWVGKHLIIALEVTNTAITGLGTIDGNCYAFVDDAPTPFLYKWRYGITSLKDEEAMRPGQLICFIECRNVTVTDITIRNSPCWSSYFLGCEFVTVRGIKVFNPMNMLNSDGIDIDTSRFVTVSDCIIVTGDDGITLRCCEQLVKNKDMHCEYITVSNCIIRSSVCGFRIGVGNGTIRHARLSGLTIDKASRMIEISTTFSNDCAFIEDVNISDVSCTDTDRIVNIGARNGGTIRNITIENIRAEVTAQSPIWCGDGTLENINLRNIEMYVSERYAEMTPKHYAERGDYLLAVKNGCNISLDNVKIHGSFSECKGILVCDSCENFVKKDCNF